MTPAGGYQLDPERRIVRGERGEAELSPLAFRFLTMLGRAPGATVSRNDLITELWSGNHLVGEPALNRLVSETRRTVRSVSDLNPIETVQKSGYRLVVRNAGAVEAGSRRSFGWARWAALFGAVVVVLVLLNLLMDSAMGLAWTTGAFR
jgi:DNA-binding winged helix-turn-helix (wHTH) protein